MNQTTKASNMRATSSTAAAERPAHTDTEKSLFKTKTKGKREGSPTDTARQLTTKNVWGKVGIKRIPTAHDIIVNKSPRNKGDAKKCSKQTISTGAIKQKNKAKRKQRRTYHASAYVLFFILILELFLPSSVPEPLPAVSLIIPFLVISFLDGGTHQLHVPVSLGVLLCLNHPYLHGLGIPAHAAFAYLFRVRLVWKPRGGVCGKKCYEKSSYETRITQITKDMPFALYLT